VDPFRPSLSALSVLGSLAIPQQSDCSWKPRQHEIVRSRREKEETVLGMNFGQICRARKRVREKEASRCARVVQGDYKNAMRRLQQRAASQL